MLGFDTQVAAAEDKANQTGFCLKKLAHSPKQISLWNLLNCGRKVTGSSAGESPSSGSTSLQENEMNKLSSWGQRDKSRTTKLQSFINFKCFNSEPNTFKTGQTFFYDKSINLMNVRHELPTDVVNQRRFYCIVHTTSRRLHPNSNVEGGISNLFKIYRAYGFSRHSNSRCLSKSHFNSLLYLRSEKSSTSYWRHKSLFSFLTVPI